MQDLTPRRVPRQQRSRFTVDAILEAGTRILRERGYAALTTNQVAALAGVSIGSLYGFFPNREAILLAIVRRSLATLADTIRIDLDAALQRDGLEANQYLIEGLVAAVTPDRELYRVLLREMPLLLDRQEIRQELDALLSIGRAGAAAAGTRIDFPEPEADVWLIVQMVGSAIIEICFADVDDAGRQRLIRELARLSFRMMHGPSSASASPA